MLDWQAREVRNALDGWIGLGLDDAHNGLLGRTARGRCVRRGEAGDPAADRSGAAVRELLLVLLVLACPLMMVLMMRGHGHAAGHGGHLGGSHGGRDHKLESHEVSTDELRRRRDELERLIEEHEEDSERDPDFERIGR